MTLKKITVVCDADDCDARIYIYTDNALDNNVVFLNLRAGEIIKVWSDKLQGFFDTEAGKEFARDVCRPMTEMRGTTDYRAEYTIRPDDPILDDLRVYMEGL